MTTYQSDNKIKPWQPIARPGEVSEARLIRAILDGTFPINSTLPGERDLAQLLGITRPTLREAMQRMERDGWLEIRHGKPTRVRDFWTEGNFGVSIALARNQNPLPADYAANLLAVRVLLCPTYTRQAVEQDAKAIVEYLNGADTLTEDANAIAEYDWRLHWLLTVHSGNPFFTHFINSVRGLYDLLGPRYFSFPQTRAHSRAFYSQLKSLAQESDAEAAGKLAERVMAESRALWIDLAGKEQ